MAWHTGVVARVQRSLMPIFRLFLAFQGGLVPNLDEATFR